MIGFETKTWESVREARVPFSDLPRLDGLNS